MENYGATSYRSVRKVILAFGHRIAPEYTKRLLLDRGGIGRAAHGRGLTTDKRVGGSSGQGLRRSLRPLGVGLGPTRPWGHWGFEVPPWGCGGKKRGPRFGDLKRECIKYAYFKNDRGGKRWGLCRLRQGRRGLNW